MSKEGNPPTRNIRNRLLGNVCQAIFSLLLALLFVALTWPIAARADGPTFDNWRTFGIGLDHTASVAVGDLDGDGDLDLVVGNSQWTGERNVVYLNDGLGNFPAGDSFGAESEDTNSLALGDLDADGYLDLVAGNDGQNIVYLNDGTGHFANTAGFTRTFGSGTDDTQSVAIGDIDGNGHLDLIAGNDGQNAVYVNDGSGNFSGGQNFGPGTDSTSSLAAGDLNADGNLDIAVGNNGGQNVVYLNDGAGGFYSGTVNCAAPAFMRCFGLGGSTTAIGMGDMDGDGDLDLLAGNILSQQNVVYLNDGGGNFDHSALNCSNTALVRCFGGGADNTLSLSAADVDLDGDLDIVAGNSGLLLGEQNAVYLNDGAGDFSAERYFGIGSDHTTAVAAADVDGDRYLDLIAGNFAEQNIVYLNDGAGRFPVEQSFGAGADSIASVAVGDINNDGHLDLVVGKQGAENVVYLNDGLGRFPNADVYRRPFGTAADATASVAVGDVDNDGNLDIVAGNYTQQNVVYLNDGTGNFPNTPPYTRPLGSAADNTWRVGLGDLDADGTLDLIAGNEGLDLVYLNDGAAYFTHTVGYTRALGGATDNTAGLALGDLDNDGDLDLVMVDNDGQNVVYLNDGSANFSPGQSFGSGSDSSLATVAGDVDGNGSLDLVVGNFGEPNAIYFNDGRGGFSASQTFGSGSEHTASLALGDLDGDGDLDLIAGNFNEQNFVYLNDGSGNFSTGREVGPGTDGAGTVAVGDLNRDGDLEIIVGSNFEQDVVYLNGLAGADRLAGNPPVVALSQPDLTQNANFYASPAILSQRYIPIPYTLFDLEGDPARAIKATYSLNGGGNWLPAVATATQTTNLSTRLPGRYSSGNTFPITITDLSTVSSTLIIPGALPITDLDVWFNIAHASNSDLEVYLEAPDGTQVLLFTAAGAGQQGFFNTILDDEATIPITAGSAPFSDRFQPMGNLADFDGRMANGIWTLWVTDNSLSDEGAILSWGIAVEAGDGDHVYTWDTFASGFFGQSDNVVFRIETFPNLGPAVRGVPGPYQRPSFASQTFPFRVRGTQVQVLDGAAPVSEAIVYRLPKDDSGGGFLMGNTITTPFRTNQKGYLIGHGEIGLGDRLLALAPVDWTQSITWGSGLSDTMRLYYTGGAPNEIGLDSFTVETPGVQQLTVSAERPLLLFDVDVSLEWDAHKDPLYRQKLESDLKKASKYLYDFSNGQLALGNVTVHQNADDWALSHVVVHATNRLRPFAVQGGLVLSATVDPDHDDIIYDAGQVRMGATWSRYGNPGESLGEDWPLALAHELSHFFLFLDDVYLGVNEDGFLIPVDTCSGSAMGDVYTPDNTEFIFDNAHWTDEVAGCGRTLAQQTLGRSEWDTIRLWYPWLIRPAITNSGPTVMPFDFTSLTILEPITPTDTLDDPIFFIDYAPGSAGSGEARAFLLRETHLVDLGSPTSGQDRVVARGGRPGDRLCVFDQPRYQYGCEVIESGDQRLQLETDQGWSPLVQLTPVTSRTFTLTVGALPALAAPLMARLYPEFGPAEEAIALTEAGDTYRGVFTPDAPTLSGHVQLWVDEPAGETDPRRETIVAYTIGGNPGGRGGGPLHRGDGGFSRGGGPLHRGDGGFSRGGGAPLVSSDGQMIFFTMNPLDFKAGELYTIQSMAGLPPLPAGKQAIGRGYNLVASPNVTRAISGSISFQYLGLDVLGIEEETLTIHFWDGGDWHALETVRSPYYNLASARSQGSGVYALFDGVTIPSLAALAPTVATNELTTTLVITGADFLPPLSVVLSGTTASFTLEAQKIGPTLIAADMPPALPAQEYEVLVINGDGGTAPAPQTLALFEPLGACFYDFFASGPNKWTRNGRWDVAQIPGGAWVMTDSPAGNYDSAIAPASTVTTYITSLPFSLDDCSLPLLAFKHDYVIASLEGSQDVARVEISTGDGSSWTELAAYTGGGVFGNQVLTRGQQDAPEWAEVAWKTAEIGLDAYSGPVRLRFSLEVDQDVADKGWVLDDIMVLTGSVRSSDLQIDLAQGTADEIQAGQAITYTLTITNAGPDTVDALVSGWFPNGAVASSSTSPACWAGETLLCHFDDLTDTRTVTMSLVAAATYSGPLTTSVTISATSPYVVETRPGNNRSAGQVQVRPPPAFVYLPLVWKK